MTLYDTDFWDAIISAQAELSGSCHYDHEYDIEYNFPAKDEAKFTKAYNYCFTSIDIFIKISESIEEVNLIRLYIKQAPEFSLANGNYQTDFLLNFSYKNWIIRINIITEKLIFLVNHVYLLNIPEIKLVHKILENEKLKANQQLHIALGELLNFLNEKILIREQAKSIKKLRNEIVHQANFSHRIIEDLGFQLFLYKNEVIENYDSANTVNDENSICESIDKEINDFTILYFDKFNKVYALLTGEFNKNFKQFITYPSI